MGCKPTIDYDLAATLIASGLTLAETASKVGAKSGETVRQGLVRRGTSAYQLRAAKFATACNESSDAVRLARDAGLLLKRSLGNTLAKHAAALEQVPAKANLQHIKQFGEAIEPLARTGKIVHDWGNDEPTTLVQIGLVGNWDATQDAIEVQSSATIGSGEQPITETPPGLDSTSA